MQIEEGPFVSKNRFAKIDVLYSVQVVLSLSRKGERKVRATQSAILPNGKGADWRRSVYS